MDSVSLGIWSLIGREGTPGVYDRYGKDVNTSVDDLKKKLLGAKSLVESVYKKNRILREETIELQSLCREVLDSLYRFTERLKHFSNNSLRKDGIKVSPPSDDLLNKICSKNVRGEITHGREPSYIYITSTSQVPSTCDAICNAYEGECLSIQVDFYDQNDNRTFSKDIKNLFCDIESRVRKVLSEYQLKLQTEYTKSKN